MALVPGEELIFNLKTDPTSIQLTDEDINEKYAKGDVRIITEQARYPLTAITGMVESKDYKLNPEFQRRRRWDSRKQSKLIESFIMNVPIPPIFLYEDSYSHYEVMDGLQRLTAIYEFYKNKLVLDGLIEWKELNGRTYDELPEFVKKGIDRRYLSSIILMQETAKSKEEAQRLKQLVFERINSGGVPLEEQESRNAIYNGPLNQLCIKLSRNKYFCRAWGIPEPTEEELITGIISDDLRNNDHYRKMEDVELVLRFFAYRQRLNYPKGNQKEYLDNYLKSGNDLPSNVLINFENIFNDTIELIFEIFGEKAFYLWRSRKNGKWNWYNQPALTVYDPIMYVFSQHLEDRKRILEFRDKFRSSIKGFYQSNYISFGGSSTTNISSIQKRNDLFAKFMKEIIG